MSEGILDRALELLRGGDTSAAAALLENAVREAGDEFGASTTEYAE